MIIMMVISQHEPLHAFLGDRDGERPEASLRQFEPHTCMIRRLNELLKRQRQGETEIGEVGTGEASQC